MLMLMASLGLSGCKGDGQEVAVAAPSASASVAPSASSETPKPFADFEKEGARGQFVVGFSEGLELRKDSNGFFLPIGYEWDLEKAMLKTGKEKGFEGPLSGAEYQKTNDALLAVSLDRLYDQWRVMDMKGPGLDIYRSPYHREVYRHYYFLRFLEVLPDAPQRKGEGKGDVKKMVERWGKLGQKAWQMTTESPYYGAPKDPRKPGRFDAPFKDVYEHLLEEMMKQVPPKGHPHFSHSFGPRFRTALLDMYLPGMYLTAIRERMRLAGIRPEDIGFSEAAFERELQEAFKRRADAFLKSGRRCATATVVDRRVFNLVGLKFEELSEMEHPLELYGH